MLQALLFDFDGVIVDSEPMHERALHAAAASLNLHFTHEMCMARYIGCADRDAYALICEDNRREPTAAEFEELSRRKWALAKEAILRNEAPAYPGTLNLIHEAHGRVPLAICSGARGREIDFILTQLRIRDSFLAVVSADDVRHSKPHPQSYLQGAALLRVDPTSCIAIEDTARGVASAKAAGTRVIAVGHTLPREQLREADRFVENSGELHFESLWPRSCSHL